MVEDQHFQPALEGQRQSTIELLCEHFAADRLTVDEFERRLDTAHRAAARDELDRLLADLPRPAAGLTPRRDSAPAPAAERTLARMEDVKDRGMVLAILGGAGRKGPWTPARQNLVVAVMGGVELDLREALLPPGVTELQVYALWGGVDIVVAPEVYVESHGFALMGGFDHAAEGTAPSSETGVPTLRITGVALMGGVDITVRHPGESARDARRRRRLEGKERRRLEGGGR